MLLLAAFYLFISLMTTFIVYDRTIRLLSFCLVLLELRPYYNNNIDYVTNIYIYRGQHIYFNTNPYGHINGIHDCIRLQVVHPQSRPCMNTTYVIRTPILKLKMLLKEMLVKIFTNKHLLTTSTSFVTWINLTSTFRSFSIHFTICFAFVLISFLWIFSLNFSNFSENTTIYLNFELHQLNILILINILIFLLPKLESMAVFDKITECTTEKIRVTGYTNLTHLKSGYIWNCQLECY